MGGEPDGPVATGELSHPPSLVEVAADHLRRMILGGTLLPGERIIENRLTVELGISRPPMREALRLLEREGLVEQIPRKGARVQTLTLHDVYEIFTLRTELERMAVDLGVPVRNPIALRRCREALAAMQRASGAGDQAGFAEHAFAFHVALVALSGHRRLEETYGSLRRQMLLCTALNRRARAHREGETLEQATERHARLLRTVESGDPDAVRAELADHGERTFLDGIEDQLGGHSDAALAWLHSVRG